MNKIKFKIDGLDDLIKKLILPKVDQYSIFAFRGPLGVGKTTIIKRLLKMCGIEEIVTSPTFAYVNTYKNVKSKIFNHFDLYRLDTQNDFLETGFQEYFYENGVLNLIEWPEVIEGLLFSKDLKKQVFNIELEYNPLNEEERFFIQS